MCVLYDLHVHTKYSHQTLFFYDGVDDPETVVRAAKKKGLDGIAITDHDTLSGIQRATREGKRIGVDVIPGCEISTKDGHVLAYWIQEPIPPYLSAEETIELIHEQGGLAFAAHPFATFAPSVKERLFELDFDGVEVWNGSILSPFPNILAEKAAEVLHLPGIAGSDAHIAEAVGTGVTELEDPEELQKARVAKKGTVDMSTLAVWIRRRAEMNREYAHLYFRRKKVAAPIAFMISFLSRLPRFFDPLFYPAGYLALFLFRRAMARQYNEYIKFIESLESDLP